MLIDNINHNYFIKLLHKYSGFYKIADCLYFDFFQTNCSFITYCLFVWLRLNKQQQNQSPDLVQTHSILLSLYFISRWFFSANRLCFNGRFRNQYCRFVTCSLWHFHHWWHKAIMWLHCRRTIYGIFWFYLHVHFHWW